MLSSSMSAPGSSNPLVGCGISPQEPHIFRTKLYVSFCHCPAAQTSMLCKRDMPPELLVHALQYPVQCYPPLHLPLFPLPGYSDSLAIRPAFRLPVSSSLHTTPLCNPLTRMLAAFLCLHFASRHTPRVLQTCFPVDSMPKREDRDTIFRVYVERFLLDHFHAYGGWCGPRAAPWRELRLQTHNPHAIFRFSQAWA